MPTNLRFPGDENVDGQLTNSKPKSVLDSIKPVQPKIYQETVQAPAEEVLASAVKPKKKGFSVGKFISLLLIVTCLGAFGYMAYFGLNVLSTANSIIVSENDEDCSGFRSLQCLNFGGILNQENVKLAGQDEGRTNFLFIGKDSTASLTDTLMLASYYHQENKIVTLNFPRDTYITASYENDRGGQIKISEKINAIYPFAERASGKEGAGAKALIDFITKEYEIPVHYWLVSDFTGVEAVVNQLGGVTVDVDKAFTDCQFPTKNYSGYIRPCPKFEVGAQKMDGTRALIYARSRMGGADGGDFARSRRQSIVIESILKETKNQGVFGNVNNINNYLKILGDNVRTNMNVDEMLSFYKKLGDVNLDEAFLRIVWETGNGFLCAGPESRGYNIVYCGGSIPGSNQKSASKDKAKQQIQNLLISAQSEQLFQAETVFLGNQSSLTSKLRNEFVNTGFKQITFNNIYKNIPPASRATTPKATVVITDKVLRDLFNNLPNKPEGDYTVVEALPANFVVTEQYNSAKIIVWIENISASSASNAN